MSQATQCNQETIANDTVPDTAILLGSPTANQPSIGLARFGNWSHAMSRRFAHLLTPSERMTLTRTGAPAASRGGRKTPPDHPPHRRETNDRHRPPVGKCQPAAGGTRLTSRRAAPSVTCVAAGVSGTSMSSSGSPKTRAFRACSAACRLDLGLVAWDPGEVPPPRSKTTGHRKPHGWCHPDAPQTAWSQLRALDGRGPPRL